MQIDKQQTVENKQQTPDSSEVELVVQTVPINQHQQYQQGNSQHHAWSIVDGEDKTVEVQQTPRGKDNKGTHIDNKQQGSQQTPIKRNKQHQRGYES